MKVRRSVTNQIEQQLEKDTILLLIGARQVGKTTLLRHCKTILENRKTTASYFTLEDPLLLSDLNEHPENIFKYIKKGPTTKSYLLIDEIQYLKDPSNFLKYLYDQYNEQLKIIATGSSAFYIDRSFKDSLAGRKRIITIYPFSFSEFLQAKKLDIAQSFEQKGFLETQLKRKFLIPEKQALIQHWQEYSMYGGYPRVVLEPDDEEKQLLLQELHTSFLKKDVYESGVKNELAFFKLLKLLASQCGELLNTSELANTIGISKNAIDNYIYILRKSYVIDTCSSLHKNLRKELTKMPKVFMIDPGLRNSILELFKPLDDRPDGGSTFENLFFSEITKARAKKCAFWRTQDKHEVDFILNEKHAFELKLNLKKFKISKYQKFIQNYPEIPLRLVVPEHEHELDIFDFCS